VIAVNHEHGSLDRSGDGLELRPSSLSGCTVGGKYLIQHVLGSGGNGTVYQAEHASIGHQVAIKVVHPSLSGTAEVLARFGREARICGSLRHPNIGQVYDVGVLDNGAPYMVMELQAGRSLREIIDEMTLSIAAIVELGCQLLAGLSAAHHAGVVHRDVKPDNVMIVRDATGVVLAKLVDFGVCKQLETPFDGRVTQRGMMVGSPDYMAPEQLRGEDIDARTDVYAVGALLYEAITGRTPFDGRTIADLCASILQAPIEAPTRHRPDCPPELELAVLAALSRDRSQRPPSAEQLARALALVPLRDTGRTSGVTLGDLSERLRPDTNAVAVVKRPRTIDRLRTLARDMRAAQARIHPGILRTAMAAVLGLMMLPVLISAGGAAHPPTVSSRPPLRMAASLPSPATPAPNPVASTVGLASAGRTLTPRQQARASQLDGTASLLQPDALSPPAPVPGETRADRERGAAPRASSHGGTEQQPAADRLLKAATTAFVAGDAARARKLYLQVLAREPQRPEALRGLGLALNRMSRKAEAARAFERYLQQRPGADDASRIRELLGDPQ
jgi:eukaryotic-like serine/threonine-protein kinase